MSENSSSPLRLERLWIVIGWFMLIGIVILSLIPPNPLTQSWFSLPYSDKIGHLLAYFVLMSWFAQIYTEPGLRRNYMISFFLLGVTLEFFQGIGGVREADWMDIVANTLGIVLGWQLAKTRFANFLRTFEQKCWKPL